MDFVRAQSLGLLSRLFHLGKLARAAVARRQQAGREEEGRRRAQQSHYKAYIRGRGIPRAEEIFAMQLYSLLRLLRVEILIIIFMVGCAI